MKQEKQILLALDCLSDKNIDLARPRGQRGHINRIITIAASLVLVVGISLWVLLSGMMGQGGNGGGIVDDNGGGDTQPPVINHPFGDDSSDYSDIIAAVDRFKNQSGNNLFIGDDSAEDDGAMPPEAPGDTGTSSKPGVNGEYIENTDNQVDGIIEGDLMKMTDKYIFRIGYEGTDTKYDPNRAYVIKVFSVDKENSTLITEYKMPDFGGKILALGWEMYLSKDANLITLIVNYRDADNNQRIGVSSLNVSDVRNIQEVARFSVDGSSFSSRMVDGRLLLFTKQYYYEDDIDIFDYTTFMPSVMVGNETYLINPDNFVIPDEIVNDYTLPYTTLLMVNERGLDIIDSVTLLGYKNEQYISENNIFLTRRHTTVTYFDETSGSYENLSDISAIGYSSSGFDIKETITVKGYMKDQYSLDEKDGHLRVVTSTTSGDVLKPGKYWFISNTMSNASLYVIDLSNNRIKASVENFAPWGETVSSVRFEGDKLYVCTAVIQYFTDPVYFFDLSNYSNITYTDTGFIEGFSTSLIDLGEGYLLGIGSEDWQYSKLEVYKRENGSVVSVDKMLFEGSYADVYKAYLINREHNLFGFAVINLYDSETNTRESVYLIVQLNGEKLKIIEKIPVTGLGTGIVRAALVDGYVYITTYLSYTVEKVDL